MKMKHCIIGGGNIGTLMAADLRNKGEDVIVYTSHSQLWAGNIEVYDCEDHLISVASGITAESVLERAVSGVDYLWVTWPAFLFGQLAQELSSCAYVPQKIGVIPGTGGAEFAFSKLIGRGCTLFGLQRVPWIARIREKGKSVYLLGRKKELAAASIPQGQIRFLAKQIEDWFEMPCRELPCYLSVTLTPSNPILHTSRLYSMMRRYDCTQVFERNFLFYEEWDDSASEICLACDEELMCVCNNLEHLDLHDVLSLKVYYESETPCDFTKKIRSIDAFRGLMSPMNKCADGWIPDWDSRYFKADFAFGLKILVDIARVAGVQTPVMERMWDWYQEMMGMAGQEEKTMCYFTIPVSDRDELYDIYCI